MFISHLKRSHKTGDRAHELSTGHKSSSETEHVRKSASIRVPRIVENRSLPSRDGRRSKLELSAPSLRVSLAAFENGTIWQHRVYVKCNTERRIFRGGISAKIRLDWSWPTLDKFEERSAMIGGWICNGDSVKTVLGEFLFSISRRIDRNFLRRI